MPQHRPFRAPRGARAPAGAGCCARAAADAARVCRPAARARATLLSTKPPQRAPFRRCAAPRLAARTRASCWVYLACGKHRYGITCRGSCACALGLGRRSVTATLGGRRVHAARQRSAQVRAEREKRPRPVGRPSRSVRSLRCQPRSRARFHVHALWPHKRLSQNCCTPGLCCICDFNSYE